MSFSCSRVEKYFLDNMYNTNKDYRLFFIYGNGIPLQDF